MNTTLKRTLILCLTLLCLLGLTVLGVSAAGEDVGGGSVETDGDGTLIEGATHNAGGVEYNDTTAAAAGYTCYVIGDGFYTSIAKADEGRTGYRVAATGNGITHLDYRDTLKAAIDLAGSLTLTISEVGTTATTPVEFSVDGVTYSVISNKTADALALELGAVAKVGEAYFTTLDAAATAASSVSGTIYVLRDVTQTSALGEISGTVTITSIDPTNPVTVTSGVNWVLDPVNGSKITLTNITFDCGNYALAWLNKDVLVIGAGATIRGNGSSASDKKCIIYVTGTTSANGKVQVLDGATVAAGGDYSAIAVDSNTTLDIQGGTFTHSGKGHIIYISNDSTTTVTGGTFTPSGDGHALYIYDSGATVNLNGGTWSRTNSAALIYLRSGKLNIDGATINAGTGYAIVANSALYIKSGTFTATLTNGRLIQLQGTASLTIDGGTFTSKDSGNNLMRFDGTSHNVVFNGGTFNTEDTNQGIRFEKTAKINLTINGGIYNSTKTAAFYLPIETEGCTITVNNGTFNVDKQYAFYYANTVATTLDIKGGTFNTVDGTYVMLANNNVKVSVAEAATINGNGISGAATLMDDTTAIELGYVARIGEQSASGLSSSHYYKTISEALTAAQADASAATDAGAFVYIIAETVPASAMGSNTAVTTGKVTLTSAQGVDATINLSGSSYHFQPQGGELVFQDISVYTEGAFAQVRANGTLTLGNGATVYGPMVKGGTRISIESRATNVFLNVLEGAELRIDASTSPMSKAYLIYMNGGHTGNVTLLGTLASEEETAGYMLALNSMTSLIEGRSAILINATVTYKGTGRMINSGGAYDLTISGGTYTSHGAIMLLANQAGATANITGGTFHHYGSGSGFYTNDNSASITLGANVTATAHDDGTLIKSSNGTVTVNGGSFTHEGSGILITSDAKGKINITDGAFASKTTQNLIKLYGTTNISGGTFTHEASGNMIYCEGSLTIEAGTFNKYGTNNLIDAQTSKAVVTINGGSFNKTQSHYIVNTYNGAVAHIYGGQYNTTGTNVFRNQIENNDYYHSTIYIYGGELVAGSPFHKNCATMTFFMSDEAAVAWGLVARIGAPTDWAKGHAMGNYYTSFANAIAGITSANTIYLLTDIVVSAETEIVKDFAITITSVQKSDGTYYTVTNADTFTSDYKVFVRIGANVTFKNINVTLTNCTFARYYNNDRKATLTLDEGFVLRYTETVDVSYEMIRLNYTGSKMVVKSGAKLYANSAEKGSGNGLISLYAGSCSITFNAGSYFEATTATARPVFNVADNSSSVLTIDGGTFKFDGMKSEAFYVAGAGKLVINNGDFTFDNVGMETFDVRGTLEVNGGTFVFGQNVATHAFYVLGSLDVTGGTITYSGSGSIFYTSGHPANVEVSGTTEVTHEGSGYVWQRGQGGFYAHGENVKLIAKGDAILLSTGYCSPEAGFVYGVKCTIQDAFISVERGVVVKDNAQYMNFINVHINGGDAVAKNMISYVGTTAYCALPIRVDGQTGYYSNLHLALNTTTVSDRGTADNATVVYLLSSIPSLSRDAYFSGSITMSQRISAIVMPLDPNATVTFGVTASAASYLFDYQYGYLEFRNVTITRASRVAWLNNSTLVLGEGATIVTELTQHTGKSGGAIHLKNNASFLMDETASFIVNKNTAFEVKETVVFYAEAWTGDLTLDGTVDVTAESVTGAVCLIYVHWQCDWTGEMYLGGEITVNATTTDVTDILYFDGDWSGDYTNDSTGKVTVDGTIRLNATSTAEKNHSVISAQYAKISVEFTENANVAINAPKIGNTGCIALTSGTVTVKGGTYEIAGSKGTLFYIYSNADETATSLTIEGGTFTHKGGGQTLYLRGTADGILLTAQVTGGTFVQEGSGQLIYTYGSNSTALYISGTAQFIHEGKSGSGNIYYRNKDGAIYVEGENVRLIAKGSSALFQSAYVNSEVLGSSNLTIKGAYLSVENGIVCRADPSYLNLYNVQIDNDATAAGFLAEASAAVSFRVGNVEGKGYFTNFVTALQFANTSAEALTANGAFLYLLSDTPVITTTSIDITGKVTITSATSAVKTINLSGSGYHFRPTNGTLILENVNVISGGAFAQLRGTNPGLIIGNGATVTATGVAAGTLISVGGNVKNIQLRVLEGGVFKTENTATAGTNDVVMLYVNSGVTGTVEFAGTVEFLSNIPQNRGRVFAIAADCALDLVITGTVTYDSNAKTGHMFDMASNLAPYTANGGIILDGNISFKHNSGDYHMFQLANVNMTAALTVLGGTYYGNTGRMFNSYGDITIKGGTFTQDGGYIVCATDGDGNISIEGGTFVANGAVMVHLNSANITFAVSGTPSFTQNGNGTILNADTYATFTVNGGTFVANGSGAIVNSIENGKNVDINGGSFTHNGSGSIVTVSGGGLATISGGTFVHKGTGSILATGTTSADTGVPTDQQPSRHSWIYVKDDNGPVVMRHEGDGTGYIFKRAWAGASFEGENIRLIATKNNMLFNSGYTDSYTYGSNRLTVKDAYISVECGIVANIYGDRVSLYNVQIDNDATAASMFGYYDDDTDTVVYVTAFRLGNVEGKGYFTRLGDVMEYVPDNTKTTINLIGDTTMYYAATIPSAKNIVLKGVKVGGATEWPTINSGISSNILIIGDGAELTLEDINIVSGGAIAQVTAGGNLTINSGSYTKGGSGSNYIVDVNGGTATINGGTFLHTGSVADARLLRVLAGGTLNVFGGDFTVNAATAGYLVIYNAKTSGTKLNIKNATFTAHGGVNILQFTAEGATINIDNATFNHDGSGKIIHNSSGSKFTITNSALVHTGTGYAIRSGWFVTIENSYLFAAASSALEHRSEPDYVLKNVMFDNDEQARKWVAAVHLNKATKSIDVNGTSVTVNTGYYTANQLQTAIRAIPVGGEGIVEILMSSVWGDAETYFSRCDITDRKFTIRSATDENGNTAEIYTMVPNMAGANFFILNSGASMTLENITLETNRYFVRTYEGEKPVYVTLNSGTTLHYLNTNDGAIGIRANGETHVTVNKGVNFIADAGDTTFTLFTLQKTWTGTLTIKGGTFVQNGKGMIINTESAKEGDAYVYPGGKITVKGGDFTHNGNGTMFNMQLGKAGTTNTVTFEGNINITHNGTGTSALIFNRAGINEYVVSGKNINIYAPNGAYLGRTAYAIKFIDVTIYAVTDTFGIPPANEDSYADFTNVGFDSPEMARKLGADYRIGSNPKRGYYSGSVANALNHIDEGGTLNLFGDLNLSTVTDINKSVTIKGIEGANVKITVDYAGYAFRANSGADVRFENVTITNLKGGLFQLRYGTAENPSTITLGKGAYAHVVPAKDSAVSFAGDAYADFIVEKGAYLGIDAGGADINTYLFYGNTGWVGNIHIYGTIENNSTHSGSRITRIISAEASPNSTINFYPGSVATLGAKTASDSSAIVFSNATLNIMGGDFTVVPDCMMFAVRAGQTINVTADSPNYATFTHLNYKYSEGGFCSSVFYFYGSGTVNVKGTGVIFNTIAPAFHSGSASARVYVEDASFITDAPIFTNKTYASMKLVNLTLKDDAAAVKNGAFFRLNTKRLGTGGYTTNYYNGYFTDLASAIAAAKDGDVLYFIQSATLEPAQIVLDGKSMTFAGISDDIVITVSDTSDYFVKLMNGADLTIESITILANGNGVLIEGANTAADPTTLTVAENAKLIGASSTATDMITLKGKYADLVISGTVGFGMNNGSEEDDECENNAYLIRVNDAAWAGTITLNGNAYVLTTQSAKNGAPANHYVFFIESKNGTLVLNETATVTMNLAAHAGNATTNALVLNRGLTVVNGATLSGNVAAFYADEDGALLSVNGIELDCTAALASASAVFYCDTDATAVKVGYVARLNDATVTANGVVYYTNYYKSLATALADVTASSPATIYVIADLTCTTQLAVPANADLTIVGLAVNGVQPTITETYSGAYFFIVNKGATVVIKDVTVLTNGQFLRSDVGTSTTKITLDGTTKVQAVGTFTPYIIQLCGDVTFTLGKDAIVSTRGASASSDARMFHVQNSSVAPTTINIYGTLDFAHVSSAPASTRMFYVESNQPNVINVDGATIIYDVKNLSETRADGKGASHAFLYTYCAGGTATIFNVTNSNIEYLSNMGSVFMLYGGSTLNLKGSTINYLNGEQICNVIELRDNCTAVVESSMITIGGKTSGIKTIGTSVAEIMSGAFFNKGEGYFAEVTAGRLDIYGGTFAKTSVADVPAFTNKATMNVYGGSFYSDAQNAPIFEGTAGNTYLNGFVAGGAGSLITNLGGGYSSTAHEANGKTMFNNLVTSAGAAPILKDGKLVLRFKATMSASAYAYLQSLTEDDTVSFGMLIAPKSELVCEQLFNHAALANGTYLDIKATAEDITVEEDGCITIRVELDEFDAATVYAFTFYAEYQVNGKTVYSYSDYVASKHSRSAEQIARAALNDLAAAPADEYVYEIADGKFSPFSLADREILKSYLTEGTDEALLPLDIYLIAGGTSAAGTSLYTDKVAADFAVNGNVFYSGITAHNASNVYGDYTLDYVSNRYVPAGTPAGFGQGANSTLYGPEIGIANALSAYYNAETGKQAAIIKYAFNDLSITNTSYFYKNLMTTVQAEIEAYEAMGYAVNIVGMYWMQGEADCGNVEGDLYAASFDQLVADMRADLSAMADADLSAMPVVVGEIGISYKKSDISAENAFVAMQQALANAENNISVVHSSLFTYADGAFLAIEDVIAGGEAIVANLLAGGNASVEIEGEIEIPEITPAVKVVTPEGVEIEMRSLAVAITRAPKGSVVKLVEDLELYNALILDGVDGVTLDGNFHEIIAKTEDAAIVVNGSDITFNDLLVTQTTESKDACAIVIGEGANVTFYGETVVSAYSTVIKLVGENNSLTVKDGIFYNFGEDADGAVIDTTTTNVLIQGGSFTAVGNSACVSIDSSAPYQLVVNIEGGEFTADGYCFINNAYYSILVVSPKATVNGEIFNAGFGNGEAA